MIPELGLFCLIIGLLSAIVLALSPVTKRSNLSFKAAYTQCFFVLLSFFSLMLSFVQDDFTVAYVANNSNTNLPLLYKICAIWGAHEGSLLLWALILTLWTVSVAVYCKKLPQEVSTRVLAVLGAISVGFISLILQTSNPFERLLPFSPQNGADLNPLLQDPGFVLHPPFLYLGYVGFAVPFAFAITALLLKSQNIAWTTWARPFALLAWSFLTIGITLGSWWAYYELGWGGWWFWDPVENASFMPWLVGAALGHALLVTSKNNRFASWSILLALSAFILSLIGTFLVRSGVISSVHAFASDPGRGTYILCFLGVVIFASFTLYISRMNYTEHKRQLALLSKESFILLANTILFVAMLSILLGTLYPIGIELLQGEKVSVGPPYFNAVFIPLMIPLLLLMSIAPYIHWHNDTLKDLWHKIKKIVLLFIIALTALFFLKPILFISVIGLMIGTWIILTTLFKCRQWSMALAHIGVAMSVIGISLVSALQTEKELNMSVGDIIHINNTEFIFKDINDITGPNFEGVRATFEVIEGKHSPILLYPEKRFFIPRNIPMTETAISAGFLEDYYIALGEKFEQGGWSVRIYIKPFIRWIWLGGILIALGALTSSVTAFRKTNISSEGLIS